MKRKAFTLIELLIVVAIIAILAAIAVPNFLEAQVRAKVSRVKADMRTMDTGLKSYYVDYNRYPFDRAYSSFPSPLPNNMELFDWSIESVFMLSTPIAYLTSTSFSDPFIASGTSATAPPGWPLPPSGELPYYNLGYDAENGRQNWGDAVQNDNDNTPTAGFVLLSYGPNNFYEGGEWVSAGPNEDYTDTRPGFGAGKRIDLLYDPTNGTVSDGDIVRVEAPGGIVDSFN